MTAMSVSLRCDSESIEDSYDYELKKSIDAIRNLDRYRFDVGDATNKYHRDSRNSGDCDRNPYIEEMDTDFDALTAVDVLETNTNHQLSTPLIEGKAIQLAPSSLSSFEGTREEIITQTALTAMPLLTVDKEDKHITTYSYNINNGEDTFQYYEKDSTNEVENTVSNVFSTPRSKPSAAGVRQRRRGSTGSSSTGYFVSANARQQRRQSTGEKLSRGVLASSDVQQQHIQSTEGDVLESTDVRQQRRRSLGGSSRGFFVSKNVRQQRRQSTGGGFISKQSTEKDVAEDGLKSTDARQQRRMSMGGSPRRFFVSKNVRQQRRQSTGGGFISKVGAAFRQQRRPSAGSFPTFEKEGTNKDSFLAYDGKDRVSSPYKDEEFEVVSEAIDTAAETKIEDRFSTSMTESTDKVVSTLSNSLSTSTSKKECATVRSQRRQSTGGLSGGGFISNECTASRRRQSLGSGIGVGVERRNYHTPVVEKEKSVSFRMDTNFTEDPSEYCVADYIDEMENDLYSILSWSTASLPKITSQKEEAVVDFDVLEAVDAAETNTDNEENEDDLQKCNLQGLSNNAGNSFSNISLTPMYTAGAGVRQQRRGSTGGLGGSFISKVGTAFRRRQSICSFPSFEAGENQQDYHTSGQDRVSPYNEEAETDIDVSDRADVIYTNITNGRNEEASFKKESQSTMDNKENFGYNTSSTSTSKTCAARVRQRRRNSTGDTSGGFISKVGAVFRKRQSMGTDSDLRSKGPEFLTPVKEKFVGERSEVESISSRISTDFADDGSDYSVADYIDAMENDLNSILSMPSVSLSNSRGGEYQMGYQTIDETPIVISRTAEADMDMEFLEAANVAETHTAHAKNEDDLLEYDVQGPSKKTENSICNTSSTPIYKTGARARQQRRQSTGGYGGGFISKIGTQFRRRGSTSYASDCGTEEYQQDSRTSGQGRVSTNTAEAETSIDVSNRIDDSDRIDVSDRIDAFYTRIAMAKNEEKRLQCEGKNATTDVESNAYNTFSTSTSKSGNDGARNQRRQSMGGSSRQGFISKVGAAFRRRQSIDFVSNEVVGEYQQGCRSSGQDHVRSYKKKAAMGMDVSNRSERSTRGKNEDKRLQCSYKTFATSLSSLDTSGVQEERMNFMGSSSERSLLSKVGAAFRRKRPLGLVFDEFARPMGDVSSRTEYSVKNSRDVMESDTMGVNSTSTGWVGAKILRIKGSRMQEALGIVTLVEIDESRDLEVQIQEAQSVVRVVRGARGIDSEDYTTAKGSFQAIETVAALQVDIREATRDKKRMNRLCADWEATRKWDIQNKGAENLGLNRRYEAWQSAAASTNLRKKASKKKKSDRRHKLLQLADAQRVIRAIVGKSYGEISVPNASSDAIQQYEDMVQRRMSLVEGVGMLQTCIRNVLENDSTS